MTTVNSPAADPVAAARAACSAAADPDAANPWVPVSACGPECLDGHHRCRAGGLRVTLRMLALATVVSVAAVTGLATLATPRRIRHRHWRVAARGTLAALGLRVEVVDHRPARARRSRGELVVVNHVSFLDIFAVAAVTPARFVAKREVLDMGPIGTLTAMFGILPHRRGDLRELPPLVARVSGLLGRSSSSPRARRGAGRRRARSGRRSSSPRSTPGPRCCRSRSATRRASGWRRVSGSSVRTPSPTPSAGCCGPATSG